jgi:hypothetical protein
VSGAGAPKLAASTAGATERAAGTSTNLAHGKLIVTWSLEGAGLGLGVKLTVPETSHQTLALPAVQQEAPKPSETLRSAATRTQKPATSEPESFDEASPLSTSESTASSRGADRPASAPSTVTRPHAAKLEGSSVGSGERTDSYERALEEESALLAQARAQLRDGDTESCLGILWRAKRRFPSSVLSQEREALEIEAFAAVGQVERARELADDFAHRHPDSPHAARVQELAE